MLNLTHGLLALMVVHACVSFRLTDFILIGGFCKQNGRLGSNQEQKYGINVYSSVPEAH